MALAYSWSSRVLGLTGRAPPRTTPAPAAKPCWNGTVASIPRSGGSVSSMLFSLRYLTARMPSGQSVAVEGLHWGRSYDASADTPTGARSMSNKLSETQQPPSHTNFKESCTEERLHRSGNSKSRRVAKNTSTVHTEQHISPPGKLTQRSRPTLTRVQRGQSPAERPRWTW